jgi:hypothetical protein
LRNNTFNILYLVNLMKDLCKHFGSGHTPELLEKFKYISKMYSEIPNGSNLLPVCALLAVASEYAEAQTAISFRDY